jgi:release factor glutamine methyltransferase
MRPAQVVRHAADYLEARGVEAPLSSAEVLLAHTLCTSRSGLYAREAGLSNAEARAFGRALCRRSLGTPVQHITGEQGFRRLNLSVRPGVFIPRPETEVLVGVALDAIAGTRAPVVIDVGTGTGAVALAIADEHPGARVWATDRSPQAVALARQNAESLGLSVQVVHGDLLASLPRDLRGRVDLVVSNPPYVSPEAFDALPADVRTDPREALLGGLEGYERLAAEAASWLDPGGTLALEIEETQGAAVCATLRAAGFDGAKVVPDLNGRDRVVLAHRP